MKITELAALVQVRNHIMTVVNDRAVTKNTSGLNDIRVALDRKFVEGLKSLDIDNLFSNDLLLVKVGGNGYSPTEADLQQWRDIFEQAQADPDFKIFTHSEVDVTQFEISPNTDIRVCPAVQPRSIEVSKNISITRKGQLTLPMVLEQGNKGEAQDIVLDVNRDVDGKIEGSGRSGDLDLTKKQVEYAVEQLAQGDIEVLDKKLDKLEKQGVKLEPAVVEGAAKPIKAPQERKKRVVEKVEEQPKASVDADPEFQEALKKAKNDLKKQGRSNTKVKRSNDETG